jgi:hypothetical protein
MGGEPVRARLRGPIAHGVYSASEAVTGWSRA